MFSITRRLSRGRRFFVHSFDAGGLEVVENIPVETPLENPSQTQV